MANRILYQDSYLQCIHAQTPQPNPKSAKTSISEAMTIYYNISGTKRAVVEGSVYALQPGELLILGESEASIVYEEAGKPSEFARFTFSRYAFRHLDPEFTFLVKFTQRGLGIENAIHLDERQNTLFLDCLSHIERISNRSSLRISYMGALMLFINEINASSSYRAPNENQNDRDIIAYINTNLAEDLTSDKLAAHFYMSESQFYRHFKKLTGTSLTSYITRKRVNLARDLLRNNVKIKDVMSMCGFNDYTTFYKCNIKYYKMPPSYNYTRKDSDPLLLNGLYQIF